MGNEFRDRFAVSQVLVERELFRHEVFASYLQVFYYRVRRVQNAFHFFVLLRCMRGLK